MQSRSQFQVESGIAAFFDLDGTLLAPPSLERRFFHLLRRRKLIGARHYFAWLCEAVRMLPLGVQQITYANKMYLRGVPEHAARLEAPFLPFYREALECMAWHAAHGHLLIIVSGTLEPLARLAAEDLAGQLSSAEFANAIRICATRLEKRRAYWTGRILGEAMFGEAKTRAIRRIAAQANLDLERCFAYGDSVYDRPMLKSVGRPAAVNPTPDLERIARRNHWPILRWSELDDSARPMRPSSKTEIDNRAMSMHPQPQSR